MITDAEQLIEQLRLQADIFEQNGDLEQANAVRELINSIDKGKNDSATIGVNMTITVDKYDGDIEPGKEPVETIVFKD
jgi:excinuclease UvrABC nuclease subunit